MAFQSRQLRVYSRSYWQVSREAWSVCGSRVSKNVVVVVDVVCDDDLELVKERLKLNIQTDVVHLAQPKVRRGEERRARRRRSERMGGEMQLSVAWDKRTSVVPRWTRAGRGWCALLGFRGVEPSLPTSTTSTYQGGD